MSPLGLHLFLLAAAAAGSQVKAAPSSFSPLPECQVTSALGPAVCHPSPPTVQLLGVGICEWVVLIFATLQLLWPYPFRPPSASSLYRPASSFLDAVVVWSWSFSTTDVAYCLESECYATKVPRPVHRGAIHLCTSSAMLCPLRSSLLGSRATKVWRPEHLEFYLHTDNRLICGHLGC